MSKFTVYLSGVEKLRDRLKAISSEVEANVDELTRIYANQMAGDARKNLAPYVTGFLFKSIVAEPIETKGGAQWVVRAKAFYSGYVEFGTGPLTELPQDPVWQALAWEFKGAKDADPGMAARPFMYPAFRKAKALYKSDLEDLAKELKI